MKLASFTTDDQASWGIVDGGCVYDLGTVFRAQAPTLRTALTQSRASLEEARTRAAALPLAEVTWAPVIPDPGKILCVGLNYEGHRRETGREATGHPTLFTRFADTLLASGTDIMRPRGSVELDYEGELAVIIGRPGRRIPVGEALDHVAGYACLNDVSLRDWQRHTSQFTPGKNFPATAPFGPWMVTPDEVGDVNSLRLTTRVNDAVVQEAGVDQMIFSVPHLIAYCSTFTELRPGDVIATGTPGGVGSKRQPPLWLKPGDRVVVEITRVGVLGNGVVDEA